MMVFKRKQIVVLSLVLMIVVAGYLQYSYKKSSVSSADKDSGKIGEAVYVDNEELAVDGDIGEEENITSASKEANDFFAQAKLDKDMTRSKNEDSLKGITDDETTSKEVRDEAYEKMINMAANSDKEMRIENLIKEKGFEDALAVFGDDGSLDIVVKAPTLTSSDVAKISDIASRQAKIDIKNIVIKNIY